MNDEQLGETDETSSAGRLRIVRQAQQLYQQNLEQVHARRDRAFAVLMVIQWAGAIAVALIFSPRSWAGKVSTAHLHLFVAVGVGAALTLPSLLLARYRAGWWVTRQWMSIAQMLWSAVFVHLTGGRIETHFHVFGSLAFVAFYRDARALLTASAVVVAEHLTRGLLWPESVFGISNPEWWRFLEHGFWVAFEDVVLLLSIADQHREMKTLARRQVEVEDLNQGIEKKVLRRTKELSTSREQYRTLVESTRSIPWLYDRHTSCFTYIAPQVERLKCGAVADWLTPDRVFNKLHPEDRAEVRKFRELVKAGSDFDFEMRLRNEAQEWVCLHAVGSVDTEDDEHRAVRGTFIDVTEQRKMERELQQAQKLESVGRLASGVAHEINTPIQFVNDTVYFLRDAFTDTLGVLDGYRKAFDEVTSPPAVTQRLEAAEEEADLGYLLERVPQAFERSLDGLNRVATLVRSMKEFAHPEQREKTPVDLNHALETTLTIARHEYKYCAEVETHFEPGLPMVTCVGNELNQVFLNLIVNAAHAIEEVVKGTSQRGKITLSSRQRGDQVEITVADTGAGIPLSIREKVFDPFFTTKEVGKGTGQGLAIARGVVVDRHHGELFFESEPGRGTTFTVRLPIIPAEGVAVVARTEQSVTA